MPNRSNFRVEALPYAFQPGQWAVAADYTQTYEQRPVLHYHNCVEIGRCLSGSGTLFLEGRIFPFSAGSVFIILPGCVHDAHVQMSGPTRTPSCWRYLFWNGEEPEAAALPSSLVARGGDLTALFDMMAEEVMQQPTGWQTVLAGLHQAFFRKAARLQTQPAVPGAGAELLTEALRIVAGDYPDLTVAALADRCGISVSYLRKLFQAGLGQSPRSYLQRLRLEMACHLLLTTRKSVLAVAQEAGFQNVSTLNRLFRQTYGITPREMRESGLQNPPGLL